MGRLAKNYLYTVSYQLLVLLAPIVTAPYLARVLGADELGIYGYVYSSSNVITTLSLLGIYAYGTRQIAYVRDASETLTRTFWELARVRLILGSAGTLVYAAYAALNPAYRLFFLIYYPYILAEFLDCSWVFVGVEDMAPAVLKNFVTKLLNVIGIFLFVRRRGDVWIYLMLLAITTLLANLSIYTQLHRYVGRPKARPHMTLRHIRGSLELFLPQVASVFYLQMDKVMLQWLTGTTRQVSFYDQAEKIVMIPLSFITVISSVMMPRIANEFKKDNAQAITALLNKAGRFALMLACPMMVGLFVVARQFVPWYLGEEFLPVGSLIMILVPIVVLNSLAGISGQQYFTATNQTRILLRAYVSAAMLNIGCNALLIPRLGAYGAAAATVLSSLVSVLIQYRYLSAQIPVRGFLRYGGIYGVPALVMGLAVYFTTRAMPARIVTTLVQILIGCAVYFVLLLLRRDTLLRELWEMVRRKRGDTHAQE